MHPAHQDFVSRPVFCRLLDLFELLDRLELRDRHSILGPVYQDLFRAERVQAPPGMDEDAAMQWVYDGFKEKALGVFVQMQIHWAFMTVGIVTTTLMWLYAMSDEQRIPEVVENNRKDAEAAREQFAKREITQQQLDWMLGIIEERINNMRSDITLLRDQYVRFCEQVVARLPKQPRGT
jgi:uncharacterized membrane protein